MKNGKKLLIILVWLLAPAFAFASTSARDADIDLQLNDGSIAPATGSQTLPAAPASSQQKFIDPYLPAAMQGGLLVLGQTDGKARIYEVKGEVKRAVQGNPVEKKLKKGDKVKAGDIIITGPGASASLAFDENYKNAVHIPENSQANIISIEPTEIKIINGSIFSAVDGLPQGATWKVGTPVAIAAVRGTLYVVRYIAADGTFYAATVDVPEDGKFSSIDIQELDGSTDANVPEGKQITFKEGETPDPSLVADFDESSISELMKFFEQLKELRSLNDGLNTAPATSGDLMEPNIIDPAGPGVVGGGNDPLDPIDTGILPPEPFEPVEETHKEREPEYPGYGECQGEQCYYNLD